MEEADPIGHWACALTQVNSEGVYRPLRVVNDRMIQCSGEYEAVDEDGRYPEVDGRPLKSLLA